MKRKCVLGVLKTEEGLRIKEEMLAWLEPFYDVETVEVDPPNDVEFELPFIKRACEVALENRESVLYLHTKGAAMPNRAQPIVREMWRRVFTNERDTYFKVVDERKEAAVSALFVAPKRKICWYNGFVLNVKAAENILKVLKIHEDRYWFEQSMLSEANVDVVGPLMYEDGNQVWQMTERYVLTAKDNRNVEKKYSILCYNFNNYEIIREPEEIDPECEYIYVTDNPDLQKQTKVWKVVIDESLNGLDNFEKCYRVRFNLFKYANTDVCIYLDGSIQIHKSLRKLYDSFIDSECDIGLNIHPERDRLDSEYLTWMRYRDYTLKSAHKCLSFLENNGYNFDYRGLYQGTIRICKNTDLNRNIDEAVFKILKYLGGESIERLDQTIYSYVLNILRYKPKIFPLSQQVIQSSYMTWCFHASDIPIPYNSGNEKANGYVYNNSEKLFKINYRKSFKSYSGEKAIISLTTWKARIDTVYNTLYSLLRSCQNFHIVLVLSTEEFPNMEDELPDSLVGLFPYIEILWVKENVKSLKKVLYTMTKYKEVPIISADDDLTYITNYAEELYELYLKNKDHICTVNARMPLHTNGTATLYFPKCFGEDPVSIMLKNKYLDTYMYTDDAYYEVLRARYGIKVAYLPPHQIWIQNYQIEPLNRIYGNIEYMRELRRIQSTDLGRDIEMNEYE